MAFVVVAVLVWGLGTCVFIYFWPPMTYSAYKRAVVQHGLGGGPIPVNTLYAVGAQALFALGVKRQLSSNRNQRRALRRRLARPLHRAAGVARAGHGGPLLQRAVH
jgi:hypothetical protein